jgi:hypothetical protein
MTLHEVITNLLNRPDLVAFLEPNNIISLDRNGMLIDETKPYRAYPRLRALHCMATTWRALSREQIDQEADAMRRDLERRGVVIDN